MQEAKKSMKEKGIKAEQVKNLPPIEEIHGLDNPTQVVEVNSLQKFDEGDIPHNKSARQCFDEFDNFIVKQENFNAYVSNYMNSTINDLKLISKHASIVTTQVEQVLKAQDDLFNELNSKNK